MTRKDVIVLLNGIMHYFEDHWAFADLSDEEIADSYKDLDKFDSDEVIYYGLIEYLKEYRDSFEEIAWSIDAVVNYMEANPIRNHILSDLNMRVEFAWENDLSDRTCQVSVGPHSVFVTFVCNRRPNDELSNASAIANAISWYLAYPTEEEYCKASGEEPICYLMTKSVYTNLKTLLTDNELHYFTDLADLF